MGNLPDLRILFYFALFGFACAFVIASVGASWLAYHLFMALAAYLGA